MSIICQNKLQSINNEENKNAERNNATLTQIFLKLKKKTKLKVHTKQ
jgi:hypothetical protein